MFEEFTSLYWRTLEDATKLAFKISNNYPKIWGDIRLYSDLKGQYITAIKGEPFNKDKPEECWAITNRYDPRVVALRGK